jgi:hypothetical protein
MCKRVGTLIEKHRSGCVVTEADAQAVDMLYDTQPVH